MDVDITAMALTALAPYYEENSEAKAAADLALSWISEHQESDGGFCSSMDTGTESSESCAQVLTALCSLGIDPQSDSRFIKNGNTVLDNLMSFRQEDGGFVHAYVYDASNPASIPDESDFLAGGQAAYALTAFCRYKNNMKNLFNLRPEKASLLSKNGSAMPVMVIAVVIAVIAAAVVLMLKKKKQKRMIRHRRSMGCHDSKNRIQVCKNTVGKKILTDFAESKQYKYNRTVMRKRGAYEKNRSNDKRD